MDDGEEGRRNLEFDLLEEESDFEEEGDKDTGTDDDDDGKSDQQDEGDTVPLDQDTPNNPLHGLSKKKVQQLFEKEFLEARKEELLWRPTKDDDQAYLVASIDKSSILILGMLAMQLSLYVHAYSCVLQLQMVL